MKRTFIHIILLLAFLVYGCTEKMDIKLDSTYTRLIVDASISTDTTVHSVLLSKTASYFDNSAPLPVTGAIVTFNDGTTTFPLTENLQQPGLYLTAPNVLIWSAVCCSCALPFLYAPSKLYYK